MGGGQESQWSFACITAWAPPPVFPCHPPSMEKLSSTKLVPSAKEIGDSCSMQFSTMAAPIYVSTNSAQGFPFLHMLTNTYLPSLRTQPLLQVWGTISSRFRFARLWWWVPFVHLLAICTSSLRKMFTHFICLCFNKTVFSWCLSSLYILDINPLSDIWFANIFSHSVGCIFTILISFFAAQKLLSLR